MECSYMYGMRIMYVIRIRQVSTVVDYESGSAV